MTSESSDALELIIFATLSVAAERIGGDEADGCSNGGGCPVETARTCSLGLHELDYAEGPEVPCAWFVGKRDPILVS